MASILSSIMNVSRLDKNFSSYSSCTKCKQTAAIFLSHFGLSRGTISLLPGSRDKWPAMETPAGVSQLYFVSLSQVPSLAATEQKQQEYSKVSCPQAAHGQTYQPTNPPETFTQTRQAFPSVSLSPFRRPAKRTTARLTHAHPFVA